MMLGDVESEAGARSDVIDERTINVLKVGRKAEIPSDACCDAWVNEARVRSSA
jgi:hypothetical protein